MQDKPFKILSEEYGVNFFIWAYHGDGFASPMMKPYLGTYLPQLVVIMRDKKGAWGTAEKDWETLGKTILSELENDSLDIAALRERTEKVGRRLISESLALTPEKVAAMDERQMADWVEPVFKDSADVVAMGFIPVASDFHHNLLTNRLEDIIADRIGENAKRSAKEYLTLLCSSPLSEYTWAESESAHGLATRLAKKAGKEKAYSGVLEQDPVLNPALKKHAEKFAWVFYGYQGPLWTEKKFAERIVKIAKNDPEKTWKEKSSEREDLNGQHEQAYSELNLTPDEIRLFTAAQHFLYMKSLRIDIRSATSSRFDLIFDELEKRHGVPKAVLRCADLPEILQFLNTKDASALKDASRRQDFFICTWLYGRKTFRYGSDAEEYLKRLEIEQTVEKTEELKGQVACTGLVRGRVKIVNTAQDIGKVDHGDILVSLATSPELLPAMHKARAFVTDGGGITSHAAIVSREMKKPCLVGVRHATRILKDGDYVEVDADHGVVRLLKN